MRRRIRGTRQASRSLAAIETMQTERHEDLAPLGPPTVPGDEPSAPAAGSEQRDVLLDEEEVGPRAYAIWLARGKPEGTDRDDWFEAERQLRKERGGMHASTHAVAAEQAREANESRQARGAGPTNRDRMVAIGRGNQQAGRQGS